MSLKKKDKLKYKKPFKYFRREEMGLEHQSFLISDNLKLELVV